MKISVDEIERNTIKYSKIIILADDTVAEWYNSLKQHCTEDILILTMADEITVDIMKLYTMYEFSDKITVLSSTDSRFNGLWNLYTTRVIDSDELSQLIIN